jgi:hypothetical protein
MAKSLKILRFRKAWSDTPWQTALSSAHKTASIEKNYVRLGVLGVDL